MCNFFFFFSFLIIITLCVLPSLVFPWLWELINFSFEMIFAMKLGKKLRVAPKTRNKTWWVSATVWVKCQIIIIIIIMSWKLKCPFPLSSLFFHSYFPSGQTMENTNFPYIFFPSFSIFPYNHPNQTDNNSANYNFSFLFLQVVSPLALLLFCCYHV